MATANQVDGSREALSGSPLEQVRSSIIDRLGVLQLPDEIVEHVLTDQQGITFDVPTTQPEHHEELLIRASADQAQGGGAFIVDSRLVDYRHGETLLGDWRHGEVTANGSKGDVDVEGLCKVIGKARSVKINLPTSD